MNRQKFHTLLQQSFKSNDTEEWLDVHFTRPIGLVFALLWNRLGIHPNAITILSIFLGVAGGCLFFYTDLTSNLLGVALFMLANFCDSTDGQMARLTGKHTEIGRMLDGLSGDLWFSAAYIAIALRLGQENIPFTDVKWGLWAWIPVLWAGLLCHARQSALADYYRQIHLYFLNGAQGSELHSSKRQWQTVAETPQKDIIKRLFYTNYARYCQSQEQRTPWFQRLFDAYQRDYLSPEELPTSWRSQFIAGSRPLMKYTNLLTFNARAICMYLSCIVNQPWIYLLLEITVFQFMACYMHRKHEQLCRQMLPTLNQIDTVIFDYGGTLDTGGRHWSEVLAECYTKTGLSLTDEHFLEAYVSTERLLGRQPIIDKKDNFTQTLTKKVNMQLRYLQEHRCINLPVEELTDKSEQIVAMAMEEVETSIKMHKPILECLKKHYRLALVSNFYGNLNTVLEQFQLADYFTAIVESATFGVRKPDKQLYEWALRLLQVTPEKVVVIGDSVKNDMLPAQELGCRTIWFTTEKNATDKGMQRNMWQVITQLNQICFLNE